MTYAASRNWTSAHGGPRPFTPDEAAAFEIVRRRTPPVRTRAAYRQATAVTHAQRNLVGLPPAAKTIRTVQRRARKAASKAQAAMALTFGLILLLTLVLHLPTLLALFGGVVAGYAYLSWK